MGDTITEHRKQEERILNDLSRLIDECYTGKMSGAVVERLMEATKTSLEISKS